MEYLIDDLKKTHELYDINILEWNFRKLAYDGGLAFIEEVLHQHTREEDESFKTRVDEAYGFNYCSSVINLLNFFLCSTPPQREPGPLAQREDYESFMLNCDRYGTDFNFFLTESQKISAVFSTVGILVDKPSGEHEIETPTVHPYLALYTPPNILDWAFEKESNSNTYQLSFVKLRDDFHNYIIWEKDQWQVYETDTEETTILNIKKGPNPLGLVPFVWMPNIRTIQHPYIGMSDIVDVTRINAALIRGLSECEQTFKYCAFPMLRMPDELDRPEMDDDVGETVVGRDAVLPFNPEYSNGKPDWLETDVLNPVRAHLEWMDRMVDEAYRSVLLSSMLAQRDKAQTKSGALLRAEYTQLNSVLSKKANSMIETERQIIKLFCKWQDCEGLYKDYSISPTRQFSIDDLQTELEYTFNAVDKLGSKTFKYEAFKRIANELLPNIPTTTFDKIEKELEISANTPDPVVEESTTESGLV